MPEGFFTVQEVNRQKAKSVRRAAPGKKLDCESCGLYRLARSPKMDPRGKGKRRILVLAEAPGETEDIDDDILVGEAGQMLREAFSEVGIDLEEDCWRFNGANCWPGENNPTPTSHQIACCRKVKVNPALEQLKPKFIFLLGKVALDSLWAEEHGSIGGIGRVRGRVIPDRRTEAWVLPVFHPSYAFSLRKRQQNPGYVDHNLLGLFKRDLRRAAKVLSWNPPEFLNPEDYIECLTDYQKVVRILTETKELAHRIVFDYETSGLSPFMPGHKIHSISVVPYIEGSPNLCYSFPLQYPGAWNPDQLGDIIELWESILLDRNIKKVAHHLQFEDLWSRVILDVPVDGAEWCTMNNQHIIDNTEGITGLKWQAWERYGIVGYDDEFERYVSGVLTQQERDAGKKRASSHHFNRVHEMPLEGLLLYGGYDGIIESWLFDDQRQEILPGTGLDNARKLYHKALPVLCDQQEAGVPVDAEYYEREGKKLRGQIQEIQEGLLRSREAKLFHQKEGRPIKTSGDDLKLLLFKHLGYEPVKLTDKGNTSVDAEVLESFKLKFTDDILRMKKIEKVVTTYFDQIQRETYNGKVHPNTSLNRVRTFRPSMSRPNFANIPKREKEAKILVRKGIRVPPGFKMGQPDYAGIEVAGLCWYSEDAELLRYLNEGGDMHRDQAQNIFNLPSEQWVKLEKEYSLMLRFYTKNQWVFPEFYGSFYGSCADNLWRFCSRLLIGDGKGTTVEQHLAMSLTRFIERMREYENEFWVQFHGVRDWQESQVKLYQKQGYIETKLGFRYGGLMSRNQLFNYPIQGTAFHLLLWAMTQLHHRSLQRKWKSRVLWQVYDAMPLAIWPPEQEEVLESTKEIMEVRARERFDWINTPLKVDMEITEVDGTYADLVEFDEARDGYSDEGEGT